VLKDRYKNYIWINKMKNNSTYQFIIKKKNQGNKLLAILIDPDKQEISSLQKTISDVNSYADVIFIGGSLLVKDKFEETVKAIKSLSNLPVILFPGNAFQVSSNADAILLLSLISGRNPDLLIGQHVIAANTIKESKLEVLPTGYMLIESGRQTTASYISQTAPIPSHKPEIAAITALAGEQLGFKIIYLDGGSGAINPVPAEMIAAVRKTVGLPIIAGGGIKNADQASEACFAGADIIVIGTAFEKDKSIIKSISEAIRFSNKTLIS
jgi:phosphoglycerol geranylgeranyltransferase